VSFQPLCGDINFTHRVFFTWLCSLIALEITQMVCHPRIDLEGGSCNHARLPTTHAF
jgi:hypothetical protein